jgi:hypothetical protein
LELKIFSYLFPGAEFSKAEIHTANGISIRFPRITKKRADKSPDTATTLDELQLLFKNSKDNIDLKLLSADCDNNDNEQEDAVKNNLVDIDRKNYYLAKAKSIQSKSNVDDEQPDSDDGIDKKRNQPTRKHQQNASKDVDDNKNADNLEKKKISSKDGKNEIIDKKSNKSFDTDEKLNCRSADTPTKRRSNNTHENNKYKNDSEQVDGKNLLKKAEKRNLQIDDDMTSGVCFDNTKTSTTTSSSGSVGKKSKINYNADGVDSKEELGNDKKIIINYEMNVKNNNNKDAAVKSEKMNGCEGSSSNNKKSKRKPYADDNDIKNNKNSILKYIKATNKNNSSASSSAAATTASTTNTKAASVADDCYGDADDDYYDNNKKMKMENAKIEKLFHEKSHLNNNIFKGVSLYVTTEKLSQALDKELRYFTQWGGKVVHKTLNCTHALHKKDYISEDMNLLR